MLVKQLQSKGMMYDFLIVGVVNHMTGNQSIFVKNDTSSNSQVKMGNGALV